MKTNPLVSVLIAALFINTAATAIFTYQYMRALHNLSVRQYQRARISQGVATFQSLVSDTVEYSKKNPAVLPALRVLGISPAKNNPSAPTPQTPGK